MRHFTIIFVLFAVLVAAVPAWAFNYERYEKVDLDAILEEAVGANHEEVDDTAMTILESRKIQFEAVLQQHAYVCSAATLKTVFTMLGVSPETVTRLELGHCLEVTSAKGKTVKLYVQGMLVEPLKEEVRAGETFLLFCDYLFWSNGQPGILMSEFLANGDVEN